MAKEKSVYVCRECGGNTPKWLGQCPHCKAWNTLDETVADAGSSGAATRNTRFQALAKSQALRTRGR